MMPFWYRDCKLGTEWTQFCVSTVDLEQVDRYLLGCRFYDYLFPSTEWVALEGYNERIQLGWSTSRK